MPTVKSFSGTNSCKRVLWVETAAPSSFFFFFWSRILLLNFKNLKMKAMFESWDGRLNCHPMYSVGSVKAIRSVLAKATVRQQKKKKKKYLSFETQERETFSSSPIFSRGKKEKKKRKRCDLEHKRFIFQTSWNDSFHDFLSESFCHFVSGNLARAPWPNDLEIC